MGLTSFFKKRESNFDKIDCIDDVSHTESFPLQDCEFPGKSEVDEANHIEQSQTSLLDLRCAQCVEFGFAHLKHDEVEVNISRDGPVNLWL